jgi:hypothetical protein
MHRTCAVAGNSQRLVVWGVLLLLRLSTACVFFVVFLSFVLIVLGLGSWKQGRSVFFFSQNLFDHVGSSWQS